MPIFFDYEQEHEHEQDDDLFFIRDIRVIRGSI